MVVYLVLNAVSTAYEVLQFKLKNVTAGWRICNYFGYVALSLLSVKSEVHVVV